jgi:hypothetical protein
MLYSPFVTWDQEIYGKLVPPNDITDFQMVAQGDQANLSWTKVADLDVSIGGSYWLRYTSKTSGVTWSDATDITKSIPGNSDSYSAPLMSGTYLLKALDSSGNESTSAVLIESTVADLLGLNAVYTSTQHPSFGSSTADKGINDSNTSNVLYDSVNNVIQLSAASIGSGTHDAYYATGTHEDDVVSSGTHDDARATGAHNAILNAGSSEFNGTNFMDTASGNFDSRSGNFDAQYHTTNKLEDDNASFDSTWLNNLIRNTTDNTTATVTAVDSSTRLTLSSDLFDGFSGDVYRLETKISQLRDTTATFVAADVGRTVRNNTDGGTATISTINSSNLITLSSALFQNDHGDTWELEAGPNNLRDTGASFTSALVGRRVRNTNDSTTATVSAFVNSNELTLSSGIFDNKDGHTYELEPGYDRLYDPSAVFTDEHIGKLVRNTTDNTTATVSSRASSTELVLSSGIFDNQDGEGYRLEVPNSILRDTGGSFTSAVLYKIVRNTSTGATANVVSVSDSNNLTLDTNIFGQTDGTNYTIDGDLASLGYYYFTDQSIDLGQIYTSRLTASFASSSFTTSDLFDFEAGNFDSGSGLFDGTDISDTNSVLQVRTTSDDPAGSPTWSNWYNFFIGDYTARGIAFRAKLTSANVTHNVKISSLGTVIDMPDTIKRATGDTSNSGTNNGTKVVTYTVPFKTTPTVGITMQASDTGDYYTISASTSSGFTVTFYNSSNVATQKTFNWMSSGY